MSFLTLLLQYNQEDAEEYKCAVRLEKYFDKELDRVGMIDESQYPKVNLPYEMPLCFHMIYLRYVS